MTSCHARWPDMTGPSRQSFSVKIDQNDYIGILRKVVDVNKKKLELNWYLHNMLKIDWINFLRNHYKHTRNFWIFVLCMPDFYFFFNITCFNARQRSVLRNTEESVASASRRLTCSTTNHFSFLKEANNFHVNATCVPANHQSGSPNVSCDLVLATTKYHVHLL